MSYFSTQLGAICTAHGTQVSFSAALGIDQALLSRYLKGKVRPSPDFLRKIAETLPAEEQAALFIAHLVDELPASARALIQIRAVGEKVRESADDYGAQVRLPNNLREAYDFLQRASVENPDLADHILTTARLLRGH